jgi:hypothetical protein
MATPSNDLSNAITLEEVLGEEEPKAPSSPQDRERDAYGKQALAGLAAFGTGIPTLLGLAGSGIETLARKAATDDDWGTAWKKSAESGVDKTLMDAGFGAQEWVKDKLNVPNPTTLGEQAAFYSSSVIPNPFVLARGATLLANLATPLVKMAPKAGSRAAIAQTMGGNKGLLKAAARRPLETAKDFATKGNVIRPGVQLGLVAGIDQGVRAATDMPTLWNPEDLEAQPMTLEDVLSGDAGSDATPQQMSDTLSEGAGPDALTLEDVLGISSVPMTLEDALSMPSKQEQDDAEWRKMDRQADRAENRETLRNWGIGLGTILITAAAARYGRRAFTPSLTEDPVSGTGIAKRKSGVAQALDEIKQSNRKLAETKNQLGKGAQWLHGVTMDMGTHITRKLQDAGVSPAIIARLTDQEITDDIGRVKYALETGDFGNGVSAPALKRLYSDYKAMSPDDQQLFKDGIAMIQENANRTRSTAMDALKKGAALGPRSELEDVRRALDEGTLDDVEAALDQHRGFIRHLRGTDERVKVGLFDEGGVHIRDEAMDATINRFNANPVMVQMQRDLEKINQTILESLVNRKVLSQRYADGIRRQFTSGDNVIWQPGIEKNSYVNWMRRLSTNMGWGTTEGRNVRQASNLLKRATLEGEGIATPLDPFRASAHYMQTMMQHGDTSVKQWNILSQLLGIRSLPDGRIATQNLDELLPDNIQNTMGDVTYIGKVDLENAPKNGNPEITWADKLPHRIKRMLNTEDASDVPRYMDTQKDVLWVQRDGVHHGFHITDPHFRTALEFDPTLSSRFLRFNNFWKNVFTRTTTGNLSPFAPISFLYNQQMSGLNAAMRRESGLTGFKEYSQVIKDSVKGAWEMFSYNVSNDIADMLTESINRSGVLGRLAPNASVRFRDRMQRVVENSMAAPVRRETGQLSTSISASQFDNNISDILEEAVPFIQKSTGEAGVQMVWRIWKHFNTAMHEGTALGMTMRRLADEAGPGQVSGNRIREIVSEVKTMTGDVRRRGSSTAMKAFNASVPFSGAMLQAWSTAGRAMHKAGWGKSVATLSTVIGMPTAMEVTWNNTVDMYMDGVKWTDPNNLEQHWTYAEYYWNGFTSAQRNNNRIFFIPGKPPWEAVLIPVTPEFSLFRGIVIDGMDELFGVSALPLMDEQSRSDITGRKTNHFLAGLTRTFDIPTPPVIAALLSAAGQDLRVGLQSAIDPEDAGMDIGIVELRKQGTGETTTRNYGRTRFVNEDIDSNIKNMLQDLFGAGAATLMATYEGFESARTSGRGTLDSAAHGLDALGTAVKTQARYVQPLLGKTLRPTPNDEVARELYAKEQTLKSAEKDWKAIMTGGREDPSFQDPVTNDPIAIEIAANVSHIKSQLTKHNEIIADLKARVNRYGNASIIDGKPVSVQERNDLIDATNIEISRYRTEKLLLLQEWEQAMTEELTRRLGRPVEVNLSGYYVRPNPGGVKAVPELGKPVKGF